MVAWCNVSQELDVRVAYVEEPSRHLADGGPKPAGLQAEAQDRGLDGAEPVGVEPARRFDEDGRREGIPLVTLVTAEPAASEDDGDVGIGDARARSGTLL